MTAKSKDGRYFGSYSNMQKKKKKTNKRENGRHEKKQQ
jgi:hypothetical protein